MPEYAYADLLTTTNNGQGLDATLRNLQDGNGNNSTVTIATTAINFRRGGGDTFQLDGVALTATATDINTVCQPNPVIPGTGSIGLPSGTTAQRTAPAGDGDIRFNTDTSYVEYWNGGAWLQVQNAVESTFIFDGFGDTYNLFLGKGSGATAATGTRNTGVGDEAMFHLTVGNDNSAFGEGALSLLTGGLNNTAIGSGSMVVNLVGSNNTGIGKGALANYTTGDNNVSIGNDCATTYANYTECVFIGSFADATINNLTNAGCLGYLANISTNNAFNIGSNMKVGINQPSPEYTLDIQQVNNESSIRLFNSTGGIPATPPAGSGVIYMSAGHLFFINSAGVSTQIAP